MLVVGVQLNSFVTGSSPRTTAPALFVLFVGLPSCLAICSNLVAEWTIEVAAISLKHSLEFHQGLLEESFLIVSLDESSWSRCRSRNSSWAASDEVEARTAHLECFEAVVAAASWPERWSCLPSSSSSSSWLGLPAALSCLSMERHLYLILRLFYQLTPRWCTWLYCFYWMKPG